MNDNIGIKSKIKGEKNVKDIKGSCSQKNFPIIGYVRTGPRNFEGMSILFFISSTFLFMPFFRFVPQKKNLRSKIII